MSAQLCVLEDYILDKPDGASNHVASSRKHVRIHDEETQEYSIQSIWSVE